MSKTCYVVLLEYLSGCESDAISTIVKAVFLNEQKAIDYSEELKLKINWNKYYMGTIEIEEIAFEPFECN